MLARALKLIWAWVVSEVGGELLLFGGYGGGSRVAFSSSAMSKKKRALHL